MNPLGRIIKGFKLYQQGNVKLTFQDEGELQFTVKSGKKEYLVSINDNGVMCNRCEDWDYRWKRCMEVGGSFLCSHCYAALFKLAEIRGVGRQGVLNVIPVKHHVKQEA